ncbi:cupin domain-containing protein [Saccharicrinis sp. FJH2]|uniref:cupin domain-containing protein n=1 Tax=unclassified Saccharicrinis TaxID=2646859 RepID=UPI0035D40260
MTNGVFDHSKPYVLKESVQYAEGSIVSKIITRNIAGNITLFAFDENQNLSEHTAPFDAIVQILEGNARIIIDKQPYTLSENEMIIMPANMPHAVEADGKFKMLLTMLKA